MKKHTKQAHTRRPFGYTVGEYIDKLSIVSKKALCGLPGAQKELDTMLSWLTPQSRSFLLAVIRVAQTNMDIWQLEHSVRNAAEGSIPLHEVGRRSIMIRNTNKTRVLYKNELDAEVGSVEEKIKHLAEDTYAKFYDAIGIEYKARTREEGGEGE